MNEFDTLKMINNPALDAVRQLQENSALSAIRELQASSAVTAALKLETTGAFAAVRELQNTLNAVKSSMGGATAALEEYRKIVAPISESVKAMNIAYAPIFEQTRVFDSLNIKGIVVGLQTSSAAMSAISGLKLSGIASIIDALPKYDFLSDMVSDDFSATVAEDLFQNGEITQDDINEEISEIVSKKQFSPKAEWDKMKKSKWFLAIKILIVLVTFVCNPVTEYATDKALDKLGINEFWENSGVYDLIDSIFGESEYSTVSETEAKETVDKNKIGNVSKQRREDLIAKIKAIRTYIATAPQDENTANLLAYLSDLEKDVNGKKYGLVFEEHREEIDEVLSTHTPVLTEDGSLFIDNGGQMNFLIEGDNLASLQLLEKTHKGKIDLIYIDPPYNTGNQDFIYDDCYVDTEDGFRHSKWISFMTKRLYAARSLLTEKGVIFIQISDIELAQLRLLCDTVFGEDNFLNIISVNMKNIAGASGGGEDKRFKKNCEYILVYAKNYSLMPLFNGPYEYREIYSVVEQYRVEGKNWHYTSVLVERGDKEYFGSTVDGNGDEIKLYRRKNAVVKSVRQVMADEGISEKEVYYKYGQCIFEAKDAQSSIRTRVINAKKQYGITDDIISIEYIPKTGKNKGTLYEQFYKGDKCRLFAWLGDISEIIDGLLYKKDLQGTYWDYTSRINNLTKEGNVEFGNGKKPIDLLKRIIALYPDNEITVLDFFAGSGSTGHAVIAQNIEDGGNRQFILCTNNQNSICREKTYVRLSNVIKGYTTENGKAFEPMPASLKYFKVDYIPVNERMYYEYADELLAHIRELVELENGINFTGNAEVGIVLTEDELTEFIQNGEAFAKCRKLYMGHDLLPSEEQERVLKKYGIEISIIPDYYYRGLQEG